MRVGVDPVELGAILAAAEQRGADPARLGICLDTAHAWGAGHDVGDPRGVDALLEGLDRLVGLGRVRLIHLNDSREALGSRADRHEHLGHGRIGVAGLRRLLSHPSLRHVTYILETPGMDEGYDAVNLERSLSHRCRAAAGDAPARMPRPARGPPRRHHDPSRSGRRDARPHRVIDAATPRPLPQPAGVDRAARPCRRRGDPAPRLALDPRSVRRRSGRPAPRRHAAGPRRRGAPPRPDDLPAGVPSRRALLLAACPDRGGLGLRPDRHHPDVRGLRDRRRARDVVAGRRHRWPDRRSCGRRPRRRLVERGVRLGDDLEPTSGARGGRTCPVRRLGGPRPRSSGRLGPRRRRCVRGDPVPRARGRARPADRRPVPVRPRTSVSRLAPARSPRRARRWRAHPRRVLAAADPRVDDRLLRAASAGGVHPRLGHGRGSRRQRAELDRPPADRLLADDRLPPRRHVHRRADRVDPRPRPRRRDRDLASPRWHATRARRRHVPGGDLHRRLADAHGRRPVARHRGPRPSGRPLPRGARPDRHRHRESRHRGRARRSATPHPGGGD